MLPRVGLDVASGVAAGTGSTGVIQIDAGTVRIGERAIGGIIGGTGGAGLVVIAGGPVLELELDCPRYDAAALTFRIVRA